jgi:hypothetical protein
VIPEAPYLFSVAALSVTLAGFAGLVSAFRRGAGWTAMDLFRLREIAEFGLGNALVALLAIPLGTTLGDLAAALRVCGLVGGIFVIGGGVLLVRRRSDLGVPRERTWYALAALTDIGAIAAALAMVVAPSIGLLEWFLLFLLARPMLAFALVLASLRHEG